MKTNEITPNTKSAPFSYLCFAAFGMSVLSGCQEPGGGPGFISDDPGGDDFGDGFADEGLTGGDEIGSDDGGEDAGGEDDGGGDLELSEADIIQVEGDLLYALSSYSGLTVVDMSDPDDLVALGTWETDAQPFEMYVEDGQAFVIFSNFRFWDWDEQFKSWDYVDSSRLVALDASDPANIEVRGEFLLPGQIQDSRRVGDILYLVTIEGGYCWGCEGAEQTVVTSIDVSDEAAPVLVDQLSFLAPDTSWDWGRSVASSTERMYLAAQSWGEMNGGSLIDVVDISAGDGSMSMGAQVQASGRVFSRWQMDEYEGVLRVISQLSTGDPLIETFAIESSDSIVALGSGTLTLPEPESLRSARFDGDRAYAITAERTDPLFTIDLSDPSDPKQIGALEIPGWVYHLEPRGDRILALGFDPSHSEGALNVSLFDVSDFADPQLQRRVHFGGDWGSFGEGQNQIHKAFSILEDEQMLLVPYSGYEYDSDTCGGGYRRGVQIIDWADDDLDLRGVLPSRGEARRAFVHRERIMTVSDLALASFEFGDRDAPEARDDMALAVQVHDLVPLGGSLWARVSQAWWTGEVVIELVDGEDLGAPEPLGMVAVSAEDCVYNWVADVFAVGDHIFVLSVQEQETANDYVMVSVLTSVDISDPANPVIDDVFQLPGQRAGGGAGVAGVVTQASWYAQRGDRLAVLQDDLDLGISEVVVVDLSDPSALEVAGILARPEGQTQGRLSVLSDTLVSWHTEPVLGQPGKVRFYFDRLDLDLATPQWMPKVNVPGVIVAYDADAGRAYTVDFQSEVVNLEQQQCYSHPKFWRWDETCTIMHKTIERLNIAGAQATLVQSIDIEGDVGIEGGAGIEQLYATDSRIFAKLSGQWDLEEPLGLETELVVLDIVSGGTPSQTIDVAEGSNWWRLVAVEGARAVIEGGSAGLGIVDTSVFAQPELETAELPGTGCYEVIMDGDKLHCTMGSYGVATVEL